jgi:hypothetical protein
MAGVVEGGLGVHSAGEVAMWAPGSGRGVRMWFSRAAAMVARGSGVFSACSWPMSGTDTISGRTEVGVTRLVGGKGVCPCSCHPAFLLQRRVRQGVPARGYAASAVGPCSACSKPNEPAMGPGVYR